MAISAAKIAARRAELARLRQVVQRLVVARQSVAHEAAAAPGGAQLGGGLAVAALLDRRPVVALGVEVGVTGLGLARELEPAREALAGAAAARRVRVRARPDCPAGRCGNDRPPRGPASPAPAGAWRSTASRTTPLR
jgi:hypothetical protein